MTSARASRVVAAIVMALCLNACVAAAIPVLAGAGILRTGTDGKDSMPDQPDVAGAAPVEEVALAAPAEPVVPTIPEPAVTPTPEPELPANVFVGPAPPPDSAIADALADSPYSGILAYATKLTSGEAQPAPVMSAILRDPPALDGKRKECRADAPLVLFDLDPHGGELEPDAAANAAPALIAALQALRDQDIDIAWISASSIAQAAQIRETLVRTGLDPQSDDRLILMRNRGDRKQTRRTELARESCVIAIAGDNRADFDELYDYLVNPEAAAGLELLIGEGWFLVPPAISADNAATPTLSDQRQTN